MVYKRYIYKKGKKHGPYYYESYRDKNGKTRSRYLPNYKEKRAVTKKIRENVSKNRHPLIFVLLLAIVGIILAVFILNYQLNYKTTNEDANFLDSVANFLTGHTTEEGGDVQGTDSEPSADVGVEDSSDSGGEESEDIVTESEIASDSVDTEIEEDVNPSSSEVNPSEVVVDETPTEEINSNDIVEEDNSTESGEENNSDENFIEENETEIVEGVNVTEETGELNQTEENVTTEELNETETNANVEENVSGSSGSGVVLNETNQTLNESFVNKSAENVTVLDNSTNVTMSISTKQFSAVLGQPVRWEKKIKVESGGKSVKGIKIDLPKDSGKVSVKKKTQIGEEKVNVYVQNEKSEKDLGLHEEKENSGIDFVFDFFLGIFRSMTGRVVDGGDSENVSVEVLDEVNESEEVVVEYYTKAPYALEEESGRNKKVTIVGPDEVHYENILAFSYLPQEISNPKTIKLYHIVDGVRESVNFDAYDRNENGLVDYIEWVVPHLSNQTYEINITILNVQSYPVVGGNWTVEFNTTGSADLKITAYNETTWSNETETEDLKFLELKCGEDLISYSWIVNGTNSSVFVSNYSCDNETSYEISKVLTTGKHDIEFMFGDQVEYAHNFAYNYSSGDLSAYENLGIPTNPFDYDSEATSGDYSGITTSDNSRWITSLASSDGEYDSQIFVFNLSEAISAINVLNLTWEGYGETQSSYYTNVSFWNWSSGSWYETSATDFTSAADQTIYDSITSGISDFVNSTNNQVAVLVTSKKYVSSSTCGNGVVEGSEVCDYTTPPFLCSGNSLYTKTGYVEDGVTCQFKAACRISLCSSCITLFDCDLCFLGGTKIKMADGTEKNIEDVELGDSILSYNELTGEEIVTKVAQKFDHPSDLFAGYYLVINNDLKLTPNHPLYVNKEWEEADSVEVGDYLRGEKGKKVLVESVKKVYDNVSTYNLEVDPGNSSSDCSPGHNYYAGGILAHNKKCSYLFSIKDDEEIFEDVTLGIHEEEGNTSSPLLGDRIFKENEGYSYLNLETETNKFRLRVPPHEVDYVDYFGLKIIDTLNYEKTSALDKFFDSVGFIEKEKVYNLSVIYASEGYELVNKDDGNYLVMDSETEPGYTLNLIFEELPKKDPRYTRKLQFVEKGYYEAFLGSEIWMDSAPFNQTKYRKWLDTDDNYNKLQKIIQDAFANHKKINGEHSELFEDRVASYSVSDVSDGFVGNIIKDVLPHLSLYTDYVQLDVETDPPKWFYNSTNSTVRSSPVEHRVYWNDTDGLAGYIFSFDNGTGSYTNDSWVAMIGTANWSNVTKVINSTNGTTIKWRVYANDTDNEWNVTDEFSYVANSSIPTHDNPSIIPYPTALTTENITCVNQSTNDLDGGSVTNIYNWLVDGEPLLLLNLPFDTNVSVNTTPVKDYSGLGNNATLGNSTGDMLPTWVASPGKMGGGYLFSGAQTIRIDNSASLNDFVGKNFTLSFWYNDTGSGNYYLFSKGINTDGFVMYLDFLNRLYVIKDGSTLGFSVVSSQNSLSHYALACNESACAIYFNGGLDFSTTGINATNSYDINIGSNNGSTTGGVAGIFADFKIFNRTLSADEIEQLYNDENYVVQPNSSVLNSMTLTGENWTCEVTSNDATFDGVTKQNYTTISIQDDAPVVNLSSPADGSTYEGTGNVLFYCNVSDDYDIVNVSLYGNWSGDWVFNTSVNVTGAANTTYLAQFNVSGIPEGAYDWNCLAYDNNSQSSWNATNFTFSHDNCASVTQVGTSTTLSADACEHYNLTADNIVFDCDGHTIHGFNSFDYWGIEASGRDNVTIQNCEMEKYAKVILLNSTDNSEINSVTMYNNSFVNETDTYTYGVYLDDAQNNVIDDLNITLLGGNSTSTGDCYSGAVYGIYISDSNNTVINNSFFNQISGQYYGDTYIIIGCQGGYVDSGTEIYFPTTDYSDNTQVLNSEFYSPGDKHIWLGNVKDFFLNDSILEGGTFFYLTNAETIVLDNNEFRDSTDTQTVSCSLFNPPCTVSDKMIIKNNLFDNVGGISISNSNPNGAEVMYNTFNNIDTDYVYAGVNNIDIKHNVFANATSFGAADEGIYVKSGVSGTEIYNNTFVNMSGAGSNVIELASVPLNFSYNTIDGGTIGIYLNGVTASLNHSTISSCTNAFQISATANADLYNVSFDKSSVDFVSDGSGSLEPFYYFRVNVTDQDLNPINLANVNLSDVDSSSIYSNLATDVNGLTSWRWIKEYTQTGDASYSTGCTGAGAYIDCFTPHNLSAYKSGYAENWTNATINESKTEHISLQTPYIKTYSPVDDLVSIVEPNNQTFSITYANTTPVNIYWFVNDSLQASSTNSSSYKWVGNYSQNGTYEIKVNISNAFGGDDRVWTLEVNDTSASVLIDVLYPNGSANVSQNSFYNVSLNVTCLAGPDCGTVNVSVYHNNTVQNPADLLYEDDFSTENATFWNNMTEDSGTTISWTSGYVEFKSVDGYSYTGGSIFMNSSYNLTNSTSYKVEWQGWYNRTTGYGNKAGRNGMWLLNASKDWSTTGGDTYRDGYYSSPARGICYAQNVWTDVGGADDLDYDGYAIAADDDNSGWAFYDVMPAQNDSDIVPYETWVNYTAIINFTSGNLTFWAVNSTSGIVISNITGHLDSNYLDEISPDFLIDFHLSAFPYDPSYEEVMRIDNFKIYDLETGSTTQNVLVSTNPGGTPFYTNMSNPFTTIELNSTDSTVETFWINATGNVNDTFEFFATANSTSDPDVGSVSGIWNVTIVEPVVSIAIQLSDLLAQQLNWTIDSLPAVDIEAPGNNANDYYVNFSVSGGTADLYVRASGDLETSGVDVLGIGNETFDNTTDTGAWGTGTDRSLSTDYQLAGENLGDGDVLYLRFWLDAPSGTAAGNYNNTLYFRAVKHGEGP